MAEGRNGPKPLNLSPKRAASPAMQDRDIPSPAGTEFSMTPGSPGSFTNGPPPSNVHRIQLDFKPSMDDELELRAGQLVRLLHEYDDGWVSDTNRVLVLSYAKLGLGALHSTRPLSAGCCPTYLSLS